MKVKIIRNGKKTRIHKDIYFWALNTSWTKFLLTASIAYLSLNAFFASLYFFSGNAILNADANSFWDAYLFSFQTSTTIGYGYFLPKSNLANIIVIFDSLAGLLYIALTTGLIFSKFSKPISKVLFSKNAIIADYDEIPTLIFRIANDRDTNIVNAEIKVVVLKPYKTKEGLEVIRYHPLKLVTDSAPMFSITWMVMHKITEESPLYGLSIDDIVRDQMNVILSFSGVDDVLSQSTQTNHVYQANQIVKASKFVDIISVVDGSRVINLDKFHQYEE